MTSRSRRVCLVGAGNVSRAHARALEQVADVHVAAVCDTDKPRALALARELGVEHVFSSVVDAAGSGTFDHAHVLVPPDRHIAVSRELAAADIGLLVEKPMGLDSAACALLTREVRLPLGVNHNAVFFPAYLKLREHLQAGSLGALQHLAIVLSFPESNRPGPEHWAMATPQNLLYESGVHPLSQIYDLAGRVVTAHTSVSGRRALGVARHSFDTWQVSLECERATAQLFLSYAGAYRTWQVTALCEDGLVTAEVEQNRCVAMGRTRWGAGYEPLHIALSLAPREVGQGLRNFGGIARTVLQPQVSRDPYSVSMSASLASYYADRSLDGPVVDGTFGADVVAMCEAVTKDVAIKARPSRPRSAALSRECDVVVLGGTGFIGRHVVKQLVDGGRAVRIMARTAPLPEPDGPLGGAEFVSGEIAEPSDVSRAIRGARAVIHLAHGGRFTWEEVTASMIEPAELVASGCLEHGVDRLVYTGTIASLYLGDPREIITGGTPTDPRARERGPYEWGKAESEAVLRRRHRDDGLPVIILRPGIVLGSGGTPFHSGFGEWRGGVHCVGWNAGRNPLPLVLASDVAAAVLRALEPAAPTGRTYNVVGDVRLNARECVGILREVMRRPLVFHPRDPRQHQALRGAKWGIRALTGSRAPRFPSYRAVRSMGCDAQFDCTDLQADLAWSAVSDRDEFIANALRVYSRVAGG